MSSKHKRGVERKNSILIKGRLHQNLRQNDQPSLMTDWRLRGQEESTDKQISTGSEVLSMGRNSVRQYKCNGSKKQNEENVSSFQSKPAATKAKLIVSIKNESFEALELKVKMNYNEG